MVLSGEQPAHIVRGGQLIAAVLGAVGILSAAACDPRYGFVESNLELAPESGLPSWISLPPGHLRKDVSVSITFYTFDKARVVARGPAPERKVLFDAIGLSHYFPDRSYTIIAIDGREEIFEQARAKPLLTVSDIKRAG